MAITRESFDALLDWLDSDRDKAGVKYETIRTGLIRIFVSKGFNDAEDLSDQTINRVIKRLPDIRDDYAGEKSNYFRGVARNIIREASRRKEIATDVFPVPSFNVFDIEPKPGAINSDEYNCLTKCLTTLPSDKRELILDYYLHQGKAKIAHHQTLARDLRVTKGALRTRAHHIRAKLEKCVLNCTRILTTKERNTAVRP